MAELPALDLHPVEAGSGREVELWATNGDGEKRVQLDVHSSDAVELDADQVRDLRDWLTGWLGEATGAGATLFEATELSDPGERELGPFVRDSDTSRAAALAAYPRQGSQRWRILQQLWRLGDRGATREELAELMRLSENTVRPRLVELMEGGWVEQRVDGTVSATRKTRLGQDAEVLVLSARGRQEFRDREHG